MASSNVLLTLTKAKQQILLIMSPLFVTHARYHSNFVCEESRTLKWRDLSGTEKYKFFKHVDLPSFPELPHVKMVQEIWMKFLLLNECIKSEELSSVQISCLAEDAKQWLQLFLQVYQSM